MGSVRAVAFDLDGVLIDTEPINVRAAFEAFEAFGCRLAPEDAAQIVGRHPDDYVSALSDRFGLSAAARLELRKTQNENYLRLWRTEARLKDGAGDLLPRLRSAGYPLGLATSGGRRHVEHCLDRFGLGEHFEVVLTKDDVSCRKPDPEIYLLCARRLGVEPDRMLVVEDSSYGIRAAKAAGAACVALRTSYAPEAALREADAVVDALEEIEGLLESRAALEEPR